MMTATTTLQQPRTCCPCHRCGRNLTDKRLQMRGALIYCLGCVPVNDAPEGIGEAMVRFFRWLGGA